MILINVSIIFLDCKNHVFYALLLDITDKRIAQQLISFSKLESPVIMIIFVRYLITQNAQIYV